MFAKREPDLATARTALAETLPPLLDYFEAELAGREYLVGGVFSIADIALASQLINLELVVGRAKLGAWPNLGAFIDRITARPSFAPNLAICRKILREPVDLG